LLAQRGDDFGAVLRSSSTEDLAADALAYPPLEQRQAGVDRGGEVDAGIEVP